MRINECGKLNIETDFSTVLNPIVYYAHHMWKYNTSEETKEIESIESKFENSIIINPNGWINQCGNEKYVMGLCLKLVKNSDILVFSTIENNIIGKGVYDEIGCALKNNKKVYWLSDEFFEYSIGDFNKIELIYGDTGSKRKYAIIN